MTIEPLEHKESLAAVFRALGDPTRLEIVAYLRCCPEFRMLEGAPETGASIGAVCCQIEGSAKVTSRISHHIKELRIAGVIDVKRRGRFMVCRLRPEVAKALAEFGERMRPCCEVKKNEAE